MIRINNDIREQKYEAAATQIDAMIADTTNQPTRVDRQIEIYRPFGIQGRGTSRILVQQMCRLSAIHCL